MTVITGHLPASSQADVVRYRPLLLVLAAGKAASSLTSLGFYLFDDDVFAYLLNFLVDGFLVGVSLLLWSLAGRVGEPAAPVLKARAGARRRRETRPARVRRGDGARAVGALPRRRGPDAGGPATVDVVAALEPLPRARCRGARVARMRLGAAGLRAGCRFPGASRRAEPRGAPGLPGAIEARARRLRRDLPLLLKVLAGLGYGNDPRVRAAVGYESRCARRGTRRIRPLRRPAGAARRPRAGRRRARTATSRSSARAPAARSPRRCSPRPGSRSSCSRPGPTSTATATPRSRWRRSRRSTATAA